MRKDILLLSCLATLVYHADIHSQHKIMFFVREYPSLKDTIDVEKFLKKMQDPEKAARKILKLQLRAYAKPGLFASYGGFITVSNNEGKIVFPRKHQRPFVYMIVTPDVTPVLMLGKTVHHWELHAHLPVEVYRFEFKQDSETQLYYWDVQPDERPADNSVPLDSIVVIGKPKNIYIPTGITIKKDSPHLFLPDIYARKGFNILTNSLNTLKAKHFFHQATPFYKKAGEKYWSIQRSS